MSLKKSMSPALETQGLRLGGLGNDSTRQRKHDGTRERKNEKTGNGEEGKK